jgi:hypothetical protein
MIHPRKIDVRALPRPQVIVTNDDLLDEARAEFSQGGFSGLGIWLDDRRVTGPRSAWRRQLAGAWESAFSQADRTPPVTDRGYYDDRSRWVIFIGGVDDIGPEASALLDPVLARLPDVLPTNTSTDLVRALISSGSRERVTEALADPTRFINLQATDVSVCRSDGRALGQRALRRCEDHPQDRAWLTDALTDARFRLRETPWMLDRVLMSLGSDHPGALAWVRATATGQWNGNHLSAPSIRALDLVQWCDQQVEQGRAVLIRDDAAILGAVTTLALTGRMPDGNDRTIGSDQQHAAARILGQVAGATDVR